MARLAALAACLALACAACAPGLQVDPTLADSIQQVGMATTGQVEMSRDEWVSIAKRACAAGAHRDPVAAERIARDEGVVFVGTERPVVETVQVIAEAVCATND